MLVCDPGPTYGMSETRVFRGSPVVTAGRTDETATVAPEAKPSGLADRQAEIVRLGRERDLGWPPGGADVSPAASGPFFDLAKAA